jgi:hypothetical protein
MGSWLRCHNDGAGKVRFGVSNAMIKEEIAVEEL